jgi:uncharacterized membrane protein
MGDTETTLPSHIDSTMRAIAELHAEHHSRATPLERLAERSVETVGKARSIGILTGFIAIWLLLNLGLNVVHRSFDPPPFDYLQGIGQMIAVYITVLILITQRRDDHLAERRDQLTLELAILSEQKSAKIIQLLEELRRDSPMVADRHDPEAAALSVPADPKAVFEAIPVAQRGLS